MKPVIQQERTGCGIAAAATIAGVSYARAKAVAMSLGISAQERQLWSDTAPVRRLLARFGVDAGPASKLFRSWSTLPDCALLAIKWHLEEGQPRWHWVVFVRERDQWYVLDSKAALKTHRRTDFGRIRPKWFRPVTRQIRNHPLARAIDRSG